MIIEAEFAEYLRTRRDVRDRVGKDIYAGRLPRTVTRKLAIVLQELPTSQHEYNLGGEDTARMADIQIDIWGKRGAGAKDVSAVAELVRLAISGYRGLMGSVYVEGCTIQRSGRLPPASPKDASDDWAHRYSMDFAVTHKQAAPTLS